LLYENSFVFLLVDGTRGGILIVFKDSTFQIQSHVMSSHTILVSMLDVRANACWTFTCVYGPQGDLEKKKFIREVKQHTLSRWLIMVDFNLIYKVEDKNNERLNRRLMLRFRRALNYLNVKEIQLIGRKFTWSNSQQSPTMTRIDWAFYTLD
jgi:hypothetical protein